LEGLIKIFTDVRITQAWNLAVLIGSSANGMRQLITSSVY
jgi:hypothetical protein